jgi:hypothetical protein
MRQQVIGISRINIKINLQAFKRKKAATPTIPEKQKNP